MALKIFVPHPARLLVAVLLISGSIAAIEQPWKGSSTRPPPAGIPAGELRWPAAADFDGATGWVQSEPLSLDALQGKVVLVDFWTYSCINCIHTFPQVQGWQARYGGPNFTVLGVHTPEFRFERETANVAAAAQRYGLTYPIAQDNDFRIWNAYSNRYWPAEYLIDSWGRVRHTSFGEGGYDATEQAIRQLLQEAGHDPGAVSGVASPNMYAPGQTGELYAAAAEGADRVAIGNAEGYADGKDVSYERPSAIARDRIYLQGDWHDGHESVTALGDAHVLVRFRAGGGNLVADGQGCAPVLLDGVPIPANLSARDVRNGTLCLDGPRSYDFYAGPLGEHVVELLVPRGFSLFTFDFAAEGRR
ncbi:MAG: redoxin domain-containing protein [Halobacteriales archaeon]|nr:redoxin domain-containing protein [Halobacteriales archaeon]